MVDRNIISKLGISQEQIDEQVGQMFGEQESQYLEEVLQSKVDARLPGTVLKGTIVSRIGNDVIIEIGLKSEGVVAADEFDSPDEIEPGSEIEVLLEETDSAGELIPLSKRKADRIRGWETIINTKKEGDVVSGKVIRRIKGGLLVDIGVPVFLPASQVDIRRPGDISRFIGQEIESKILKIDIEGHNIVISRRKLIEEQRKDGKDKLLAEIEVGQLRKGVVKNIADFGIFVDLGGLDGLLHISDLSWGRISHPSEVVELDQEIECVVIGVDKDNEKISLGMKQKTKSPWETVEENYLVDTRVKGKVVNIMNYGAFIRLEDGIEGLVHISEMSWTKRLRHPSEMLNLGDEIEVVVLSVNKEKKEVSLGLKQTEANPWAIVSQKYPVDTIVNTTVRTITNFGAFVEIEEGVDGMIHISDLSWSRKYNHPSEILAPGQELKCVVLEINEEKRRISLGIKQLSEDPWLHAIPEKYIPGHIIKGKVTKITNFGAFVELESELEGLLHISEIADHKIANPQEIISNDQELEVKILKVDTDARKIGLSLRRAQWAAEEEGKEGKEGEQEQPEQKKQEDSAVQLETGTQSVLSGSVLDNSEPPKAEPEQQSETDDAGDTKDEAGEADDKSQQQATDTTVVDDSAEAETGGVEGSESETEQLQDAAEVEPDSDDKPVAEAESDSDDKPVEKAEPDSDDKPVEKAESDSDDKPVAEAELDSDDKPAAEAELDSDDKPAAEAEPDSDDKSAEEAKPDSDDKSAEDDKTVEKAKK